MSDAYVVGNPDGLSPLLVELRDAIARELHAQLALRAERIELADLPEVSYQVTIQVERTLRAWRPGTRLTPSVDVSSVRRTSADR
ncbi:hypothetical protein AB0J14_06940 [Micromonospora arborensis]|uniref:hypothetical protein n=1 Tax=Micromonospora arborensis TaxID=2116518 RepID=UPI00340B91A1